MFVIVPTRNMKVQRYSIIYLLLSLFCIIAAVSAQVTPDGNDGIDSTTDNNNIIGNDTKNDLYNQLIKELGNMTRCFYKTKIIRTVSVNFVRVLNIFFGMTPPVFTNYILQLLPYIYNLFNFYFKLLLTLNNWIERYRQLMQLNPPPFTLYY